MSVENDDLESFFPLQENFLSLGSKKNYELIVNINLYQNYEIGFGTLYKIRIAKKQTTKNVMPTTFSCHVVLVLQNKHQKMLHQLHFAAMKKYFHNLSFPFRTECIYYFLIMALLNQLLNRF